MGRTHAGQAIPAGKGRLSLTPDDLQAMTAHCRAGWPHEACGILAGAGTRVRKVYCMANARPGPVSYEMDPEEQFRVMQDIRRAGLAMVGIFHSHPCGPAYPSSVDVEKAYWPGTLLPNYPEAVYVIVSLLDRAVPQVRGFRIAGGAVEEVFLSIEASDDDGHDPDRSGP